MRSLRPLLLGAAPFFVAACGVADVTPPPGGIGIGGATFTASISRRSFAVGDSATLHFVLLNSGTQTLRLTFGSGCPVLYYVKSASGAFVVPSGGAWGCTAVITNLVLAPGEAHDVAVLLRGSTAQASIFPGVPISPGEYAAYGELTNGAGLTNIVEFSVR